jgi:hypothetical protein
MSESIQEYANSHGVTLRVDSAGGVLRGVKLIGLESQNGRRYRPEALASAVGLYEGAKVNVNHPAGGPLTPRDYRDRLGVVRQVEFRPGEGLFGNLHYNPKHALAEQLAWDAEHNPQNVGFSHNVLAKLQREGERVVVEAITHVQSVDLVADPAATQGLLEHEEPAKSQADADVAAMDFTALTLETLRSQRPDLAEACVTEATAALRDELREALAREHALRGRPRSAEQRAALGRSGETPATAKDFARALRSRGR